MKISCKHIVYVILQDCTVYMRNYCFAGTLAGIVFSCLYGLFSFYFGGLARQTVRNSKAKICFKLLCAFLFGFYLYLVLGITILSREKGVTYIIRPVPFTTWGTDLWHLTLWTENILMMVPLGIMLYILWDPFRKIGWSFTAGLGFSFIIECTQFFMRLGKFETDDIMNNVLGTLIGFIICKVLNGMKTVRKVSI